MAKEKVEGNTKKTLVLLDSHAIIHRAYHALPEFSNSKGEPTGALYGLATMLMKIVGELKPDYIVATYDLPKPTFRHEAYDGYKAGRAKTDEALIAQLIGSRKMFEALSIPIYDLGGFEADDMLGTIVEIVSKENKNNLNIIIASGDMDTLQLVDDKKVQVYTLKKGIQDTILYDEEAVLARFGFKPKFLPDYKGLRGDPSDNIIGIKGIGEKTATTLIVEFGTIENLYKELKKKDAEAKFKELGITERIFNLLKDGEDEALFSKTLATIRRDAPINFTVPEKVWREAVDVNKVESLMRELEFKSLIDRFKRVLDPLAAITPPPSLHLPLAREEEIPKYDPTRMKKMQIASWLLNSEVSNPTPDDVLHYKNLSNFDDIEKQILADIKKANLEYVLNEIELPLIPIIKNMEDRGIKVDVEYLNKLSKDYHIELEKLEKTIWAHAGREFNINSPKQLGEVLFDEMGLTAKGLKKSAGGARSTRESELEKMRDLHPIIGEIFQYRELQKLLSTYIDTIPKEVKEDGRLHAEFIQAGASTGRFSSANPNLQNIPTKSELGKNIRFAFVADKGHVLVSFDYSQIELRIAALLSQDEYFIKVFKDGKDIHAAVASKVFHVSEEDVTAEMRRRAKVINFGILYGMGVTALRQNLGGERKDAQIFYDNYFAQFPTIAGYLENVKKFALAHGYTETLFGRRRYFPGIKSPVPFIKAMAERMAINAPIQGTATADIIKIGMKLAHRELEEKGLLNKVHMVLQVHDELVYEIEKDSLKEACGIIENAMKNAIPAEFLLNIESVPLEVSVGVGKTWGDLK